MSKSSIRKERRGQETAVFDGNAFLGCISKGRIYQGEQWWRSVNAGSEVLADDCLSEYDAIGLLLGVGCDGANGWISAR